MSRVPRRESAAEVIAAMVIVIVVALIVQGIASLLGGAVIYLASTYVATPAFGWVQLDYWQCVIVALALSLIFGYARTTIQGRHE